MAAKRLGFIHLTDLHVGQPREAGRVGNIESQLCHDVTRMIEHWQQPVEIVFFTGDIAYRGAAEEYVRATAVLGRILNSVRKANAAQEGVPADAGTVPILIPVPGNHDLVRPDRYEAAAVTAALGGRTQRSGPLWGPGTDGVRRIVETSFRAYSEWLASHPLPFPPSWKQGLLPGDRGVTLTRHGISLGIVGLNSTALHFDDDAFAKQLLDLGQVQHLTGSRLTAWAGRHDFTILLTHHPDEWLLPASLETLHGEIRAGGAFDLHLFGHTHVGSHRLDSAADGVHHGLEGRSLFGAEEDGSPRLHGYTIGRFVLEGDDDTTRHVEFVSRPGWRDTHGWHFGSGCDGSGRWSTRIEPRRTPCPPVSPVESPTVELAPSLGEPAASEGWKTVSTDAEVAAGVGGAARHWIFVSASVPRPHSDSARRDKERELVKTGREAIIREFVRLLAERVSSSDEYGLVFGGHPSITQSLAPTILRVSRADEKAKPSVRKDPWLALFQAASFRDVFIDDVGVVLVARRVLRFQVGGDGAKTDLETMRDRMYGVPRLAGAIFVGGMSGVVDEFAAFGARNPKLPRYAFGAGGGAAAKLLVDQGKQAAGRLRNPSPLWYTAESALDAIFGDLGGKAKRP